MQAHDLQEKQKNDKLYIDLHGNELQITKVVPLFADKIGDWSSIFKCEYNGQTCILKKTAKNHYETSGSMDNAMQELETLKILSATQYRGLYIPFLKLLAYIITKDDILFLLEFGKYDLLTKVNMHMNTNIKKASKKCWQMTACVFEIHRRGIIHCDISLENFVKKNKMLCLIDWAQSRQNTSDIKNDIFVNCETKKDIYDKKYINKDNYCHPNVMRFLQYGLKHHDWFSLSVCLWCIMMRTFPYSFMTTTNEDDKQIIDLHEIKRKQMDFYQNKFTDLLSSKHEMDTKELYIFLDLIALLHDPNIIYKQKLLMQHPFFEFRR